jgi:O-acetylserine/cysteine efflux transporter
MSEKIRHEHMPVKHILLSILVAVVWGCNFIFVKLGVHEIPPLFLCSVRFFLASIPAIFFIRLPAHSLKMVALYGLVMFALQFALIFTGIAVGMTAGMASLLAQTSVFFSIFFAAIFIREIPTIWQMAGALLSFSGIALAAMHLDNNMTLAGFTLVIASAAVFGLGALINRKLGRINMPTLVGWGSFIAFPPLLVLSFLLEGREQILYAVSHFSWLALISLFYIVYISTWIGYGTWSFLLGRYPVNAVVPFSLLIPVFAMVGSTLFLGENFEPWKITVAGLVITGLCVNLLVPRFLAKRKNDPLAINAPELN